MSKPKTIIQKCRTVFFDLEFYVPEDRRGDKGFIYNPWDKKCRLLGGCFYAANPAYDFDKSTSRIRKRANSFWLWNYKSESELVHSIARYLIEVCEYVRKPHKGTVSPILCGINITSSDVPVIFELFKRFKALSNHEAFDLQNKFRVIDLSSLAIPAFNNASYFLYPQAKNNILNKYQRGKKFEDGRIVWTLYDDKKLLEIEERVLDEVIASIEIYRDLKQDFDKYKRLEKNDLKRRKHLEKLENSDTAKEPATRSI